MNFGYVTANGVNSNCFEVTVQTPLSRDIPREFFTSPQGSYLIRLKAETDFPLTIVTAPQSLVISTLLPLFFSRSSVSGDGCPYVFVAEQETTASSGLTISRNSAPVEYLEP